MQRDHLFADFAARYGHPPELLAWAPGRVNLIGEHTDYALLPVLPLAIDRGTWVAAAPASTPRIRLSSLGHAPDLALDLSQLARHPPDRLAAAAWQRYPLGVLAELAAWRARGRGGADLLVAGDLPTAGGLSSSASLTVGLLLALDALWSANLDSERLVERAVAAERRVGVEVGAMDQTAIVFGRPGCALRIDFAPPGRRAVPLPPDLRLVVAHSGEPAPKGTSARQRYNAAVAGCRLAAALLASDLGRHATPQAALGSLPGSRQELLARAGGLPERCSPREVARRAGCDLDGLVRLTTERIDPDRALVVRARARHALSEAARVEATERALRAGRLCEVGELIDASHASLRDDQRCSTAALDRLCAAMRAAGALGARPTGAGFGGFALAATTPATAEEVCETARRAAGGPALVVEPGGGARLLPLDGTRSSPDDHAP